MKLEVGMYVRTLTFSNISRIGKLEKIDDICITDNGAVDKTQIIKASHNLIDLIEPQDLMFIDIDPNDGCGGIVVPRIAETLNELEKWKKRIRSGECKLVSIVTSQQINEICYEVSK